MHRVIFYRSEEKFRVVCIMTASLSLSPHRMIPIRSMQDVCHKSPCCPVVRASDPGRDSHIKVRGCLWRMLKGTL